MTEVQNGGRHPRKRRRRRRLDRPAISARLLLDDRLKGEEGVLSEDLFNDLFPWAVNSGRCPYTVSDQVTLDERLTIILCI